MKMNYTQSTVSAFGQTQDCQKPGSCQSYEPARWLQPGCWQLTGAKFGARATYIGKCVGYMKKCLAHVSAHRSPLSASSCPSA